MDLKFDVKVRNTIWSVMKVKLRIKTNKEVINKIGKVTRDENITIIEYKESPSANTKLYCREDEIRVMKTGPVTIDYTHKLGKAIDCMYKVKMGEQEFSGSSKIKTKRIVVEDQKIHLEYKRDGENVIQSWEY